MTFCCEGYKKHVTIFLVSLGVYLVINIFLFIVIQKQGVGPAVEKNIQNYDSIINDIEPQDVEWYKKYIEGNYNIGYNNIKSYGKLGDANYSDRSDINNEDNDDLL